MCSQTSSSANIQLQKKVNCKQCSLFRICLPKNIKESEVKALDKIIHRRAPVKRGTHWFNAGNKFKAIYAIRSGCIKTFHTTESGEERICGFHLPGELVGLDAIDTGTHTSSAKALQTTSICEIPFDKFDQLCLVIPSLQRELTRLMSKEIVNNQWLISLLGNRTAEQRVAAMLCNLSDRLENRGYSATEFNLSMSRTDIGNYLGLTIETVSRVLGRFQCSGMISVKNKFIQLHRMQKLHSIAGV
jgi:CRP/FNR family transcriptional regulator